MKLLILTQKIDKEDPILGFFHNWLLKLAEKFENIIVVCLEKRNFDLPQNIKILSLGKEFGNNKITYIWNFYKYIWSERVNYDSVFVHMNQEYILLGGLFWKLLGKKIYFWRNHPKGSWLTKIAVWFSEKVFCTSTHSFTAKFNKTKILPVGIDTDLFFIDNKVPVLPNSILSLGRISPIKNIEKLIDAAVLLDSRGVDFVLDIVGDPVNQEDFKYQGVLKKRASGLIKKMKINFLPAVDQGGATEMYQSHQIFVNLTPSGSMDKTILEAAASGCVPVVANEYYKDVEGVEVTIVDDDQISKKLDSVLKMEQEKVENLRQSLRQYVVRNHGLSILIEKLTIYIHNK